MSFVKLIARKIAFPFLFKIGYASFLKMRSKNGVLHIMFHGVLPFNSNSFSPRHIDTKQFDQILKYLKKSYNVVSLKQAFEISNSKSAIKEKYVSISFDDGFKNNLQHALPIIEKHGLPVTIFVSSLCVEGTDVRTLWSELYVILRKEIFNKKFTYKGESFENEISIKSGKHLTEFIKELPARDRDDFWVFCIEKFDLITKLKSHDSGLWELMNESELKELSQSKYITIGSHGIKHFNLGLVADDVVKHELVESKRILERSLGRKVDMFAYPDGSYSQNSILLAEKAGYKNQLVVSYKEESDSLDTRIQNRLGVSSTTTFESNIFRIIKSF